MIEYLRLKKDVHRFFSLAKDIVEHEIKYRSDDKDITLTYSDDEIFIYTDSKGHIRYMIQEFSVEITDDTVDFSTSYTDHLIWDNNAKNSTVSVTIEHYDRSYAYAKEEE